MKTPSGVALRMHPNYLATHPLLTKISRSDLPKRSFGTKCKTLLTMKLVPSICILLSVASIKHTASASTIFDNGVPLIDVVGWDATGFIEAQSFRFNLDGTVSSITMFLYDDPGPWDNTVQYYFYNTAIDHPGMLLTSGVAQNKVAMDSGLVHLNGFPIQSVSFDLQTPFNFSGSTRYWLGLHLKQDYETVDTRWAASSAPEEDVVNWFQSQGIGPWISQPGGSNLSFQLHGSIVPEPSVSLLALVGTLFPMIAYRPRNFRNT